MHVVPRITPRNPIAIAIAAMKRARDRRRTALNESIAEEPSTVAISSSSGRKRSPTKMKRRLCLATFPAMFSVIIFRGDADQWHAADRPTIRGTLAHSIRQSGSEAGKRLKPSAIHEIERCEEKRQHKIAFHQLHPLRHIPGQRSGHLSTTRESRARTYNWSSSLRIWIGAENRRRSRGVAILLAGGTTS